MTPVVSSTHCCYVAPLRLLFYDLCGVCYVASVGHWLSTFRKKIVPSYSRVQASYVYSMHLKVKTAHQLPVVAASHPRRTGISTSPLGESRDASVTCLLFRKIVTRMGAGFFRFVRLEALHGEPQKTKVRDFVDARGLRVNVRVQVQRWGMSAFLSSTGHSELLWRPPSRHGRALLGGGGVNDVLPASPTFLIRFGQRSVEAVSANIYRVTKGFVKIRPTVSHAFRRNLSEFHAQNSHLWSNLGELSVRTLYAMLWRMCESTEIGAWRLAHPLLA